MNVILTCDNILSSKTIAISGSKSESNRLLILQKVIGDFHINNLSEAQDTKVLQHALNSDSNAIDIHHAGTAMRFLTAFYACQPNANIILNGSERMQQRPIKILVDALKDLGADISYVKNEGFPPLSIRGKTLSKNMVKIDGSVSSQYLSALLLVASKLENGLTLSLTKNTTSLPYLKMTLNLLNELGVNTSISDNNIAVERYNGKPTKTEFTVESDWSSASYFYALIALSPIGTTVQLSSFKKQSKQGDAELPELYSHFGVTTTFNNHSIVIKKECSHNSKKLELNLINTPDLAQTLAVTCFALNIPCHFTGLHTLKIKETDRLQALKNELEKLGAQIKITENCFEISGVIPLSTNEIIAIDTYNDHRMAMAFAPVALLFPIKINDAMVVEKSYPNFWKDFEMLGIKATSVL